MRVAHHSTEPRGSSITNHWYRSMAQSSEPVSPTQPRGHLPHRDTVVETEITSRGPTSFIPHNPWTAAAEHTLPLNWPTRFSSSMPRQPHWLDGLRTDCSMDCPHASRVALSQQAAHSSRFLQDGAQNSICMRTAVVLGVESETLTVKCECMHTCLWIRIVCDTN
jgi:hypothetical protein